MRRFILVGLLITVFCMVFGLPIFANDLHGNKPVTVTIDPPGTVVLNEVIGGVPIVVSGYGTFTAHIIRP